MKRQRFGDFLSEFRLHYNLTEQEVAGLFPLKDRFQLSAKNIRDIELHKFKNENLTQVLDALITGMTNFEQDVPEQRKIVSEKRHSLINEAVKNYVSPKPAFERNTVGIPKEEIYRSLCGVVNIPYLCNQLNIMSGNEPKDLPSLLKAIRQYLGYSQRSLMEEKGEKHSVTYHKMEKNEPHNPSHEFVESLVAFISKKMQTRSFRDVIESVGSKSVAVGVVTNSRTENSFDFEVLSHNKDFSRVHAIDGCRGMISIPSNQNRMDPQSHFIKVYRAALKNIITAAGGPQFYETSMVKKALQHTFVEMRRKYPGLKIDDKVIAFAESKEPEIVPAVKLPQVKTEAVL